MLIQFLFYCKLLPWVILSNKKIFAIQFFNFGKKSNIFGDFFGDRVTIGSCANQNKRKENIFFKNFCKLCDLWSIGTHKQSFQSSERFSAMFWRKYTLKKVPKQAKKLTSPLQAQSPKPVFGERDEKVPWNYDYKGRKGCSEKEIRDIKRPFEIMDVLDGKSFNFAFVRFIKK